MQDTTIIITVMCITAFVVMILSIVGLIAYLSSMKYRLRRMKYEASKPTPIAMNGGFQPGQIR